MKRRTAERLAERRAAQRRARRRRRRLGVGAVLVLAVGATWLALDGDDVGPGRVANPDTAEARREAQERRRLSTALRTAARRAAALGGSVELGAMRGSWRQPSTAASPPTVAGEWTRLWSMSKVVTMVALLRATQWGEGPGTRLSAEVEDALEGAIVRSENCRQRRVVLELQEATGGPEGARRAVAETLRMAGARVRVSDEVQPPDSSCVRYLEGQSRIDEPLAPTVLLGTSTWRVADATRFMGALGSGRYGDALTERVLALLRIPKAPSSEILPTEFTAAPDWGAGRVFADWQPAYKAGWGGSLQGDFLLGQMAWLEPPGAGPVALAATFHPDAQPALDDPGLTAGPRALEMAMRSLLDALSRGA